MVDIYNAMIAIRDSLRDNLTDPLGRDGEWIHYDTLVDLDKIAKTPTIYIERAPGSNTREFVGSGTQSQFVRIHINVYVRKGDTGKVGSTTIDATIFNSSTKLLDLISDEIINHLESVYDSINTTYIKYIHRLDAGGVVALGRDILNNQLVFEAELV
jgi:hypothetical protein